MTSEVSLTTNQTNSLIEVFSREEFLDNLERCYSDPLSVNPSWLCLLFLVLAIGLVMAAAPPGTPEDAIIQKLRDEVIIGSDGKTQPVDRAEVFYLDAKQLSDPTSGFEDADFWSVQALTLMSVYMLAVSKRNAAYAYSGELLLTQSIQELTTLKVWHYARLSPWVCTDKRLQASLRRKSKAREETYGEVSTFLTGSYPRPWVAQQRYVITTVQAIR